MGLTFNVVQYERGFLAMYEPRDKSHRIEFTHNTSRIGFKTKVFKTHTDMIIIINFTIQQFLIQYYFIKFFQSVINVSVCSNLTSAFSPL